MKLNQTETNDITQSQDGSTRIDLEYQFRLICNGNTQFSNPTREVFVPPTEGGNDEIIQSAYHCLTIRGVMCFIHTWGDCEIQIPNHFKFKFNDDAGEHVVSENTNNITVSGVSNFFFTINDK